MIASSKTLVPNDWSLFAMEMSTYTNNTRSRPRSSVKTGAGRLRMKRSIVFYVLLITTVSLRAKAKMGFPIARNFDASNFCTTRIRFTAFHRIS